MSLFVVTLLISIIFGVSEATALNVFRRFLNVTFDANPSHSEEAIRLNTYSLRTSDPPKLDSSCSNIAFLRETASGSAFLPYWIETSCPSVDPAQPDTIIWVDIPPDHNQTLGDTLWILYHGGTEDVVSGGNGTNRLFWNASSEVRLFDADECPVGWIDAMNWTLGGTDGAFASSGPSIPYDNIQDRQDLNLISGDHVHGFGPIVGCSGLATMTISNVCDDMTLGSIQLNPALHFHPTPSPDPIQFHTDASAHERPAAFFVRGCLSTEPFIQSHDLSELSATALWLGLHRLGEGYAMSNWTHYAQSDSRFLAFGANPGSVASATSTRHWHGATSYVPGSWDISNDVPIDASIGSLNLYSRDHTHGINTIGFAQAFVLQAYDYIRVHVLGFEGEKKVDIRSNNLSEVMRDLIFLFLGSAPPLGYDLSLRGVSDGEERLLAGMSSGNAHIEVSSLDGSARTHKHGYLMGMDTTIDRPSFSFVSGYYNPLGCMPDPVWGGGEAMEAMDHYHSGCTGETREPFRARPFSSSVLPDHVRFVLAYRYTDPSRNVTLGDVEEEWEPPEDGKKGEEEEEDSPKWELYVGVSLASVSVVGIGLVVILLVVAGIVIALRKNRRVSEAGKGEELESMTPRLTVREDLFTIDPKSVTLLEQIGHGGGSATVFRAKWGGQTVAYKLFSTGNALRDDEASFDEFEREVSLASSLRHPNLIVFYGCSLGERFGIVMELCEHGELGDYLVRKTKQGESVSMDRKLRMLKGITFGMAYLHEKNVIHRDLKPQNVLLDSNEVPKVADFGISRSYEAATRMTTRVGTSIYMAPEIVLGNEYGHPVDVFSFAIMAYEVVLENWHPYPVTNEFSGSIEFKVANDPSFRPDIGQMIGVSSMFVDGRSISMLTELLKACWSHDPGVRPSFAEIAERLGEIRGVS